MGRRFLTLLVVVAGALAWAGPASAFVKRDMRLAMPDGVELAATVYQPDGAAPAAGWPAVIMFHGIGGTRASMNVIAEQSFANQGYVVLTFDFRGHGESGGLFGAVSAQELVDAAVLRERWLPTLAPVDTTRVGAWGISLGGGAVLRAVGEGSPYAAIEVVETWTDLYDALVPQDLSKSGAIFAFLGSVPAARTAPEVLAIRESALTSRNLDALRAFSVARSSRPLLRLGYPPTLFFQGRRDFAFGLDQGISAFRALRGPKRLYIGAFGHAPSTFPGADIATVLARGTQWFDRFLKGVPNGIDTRPPVELAPEPWRGRTVEYRTLPPTQTLRFRIPARGSIPASGKVVAAARLPRRALETFGAPFLVVRVSTTSSFRQVVAVLAAVTPAGNEIVVSQGGALTETLTRRPTNVGIRLISQATLIPRGSRLRLTLGATSTVQHPSNLLYLNGVPPGSHLRVHGASLALPVLRRPVSS